MKLDFQQVKQGARACSRFLMGQHGTGAMYQEFCHSGLVDAEDVLSSGVTRARIYEFGRGFVAETFDRARGWRWDLYAQHVWRTGTEQWWDVFASAHELLVQPHLAALSCPCGCGRAPAIEFASGREAFCTATYRSHCVEPSCVRTWVGNRFLPIIWPQTLTRTLDAVFATSAFSQLA